jgi:predicted nucleic acid-binding Zn ribbon protein
MAEPKHCANCGAVVPDGKSKFCSDTCKTAAKK